MSDLRLDLLVVGSGAAGLSAALRAVAVDARVRVGVLTAGALLAGSSPRAQGGVAAAVGADDAPALHAADTLAVGAGLNDVLAVDVLTRHGSRSFGDLGPLFEPDLGLEAGHSRRRILHAGGGATGQVLTSALLERARRHPRIQVFDHAPVAALEVQDAPAATDAEQTPPRVEGAWVGSRLFRARAVILATGGYAALWHRSTNANETRGSGLALAWRAGASLADLEFVQFHPTALALPGQPAFLLSEALRGEGARLIDEYGKEVVDPLLPRDVVARAVHKHVRQHGAVFLSMQHLPAQRVYERFGQLAAAVRAAGRGLDLARDRLPVAPAAHYCMGGVRTDTWGRTDVASLYAAGEAACTGVQGANRLASNSLLECLVFGARAAEAALGDSAGTVAHWATRQLPRTIAEDHARTGPVFGRIEALDPDVLGERLDADVGVEREGARLAMLVAELPRPEEAQSPDLLLASLIAHAALLRAESRGAHFRNDAPYPDPAWRGRVHWRRAQPPAFEEVLP